MNAIKTTVLLTLLTVLFLIVGQLVGGNNGMLIALGFALILNFVSYWFSDKIVLKMYRAKPVTEAEQPELVGIVRRSAQASGLPMPKVYIIPTATPNAFATGRNPQHAAVAATQGIIDLLDRDELEGVMAHEMGHVKNRDILISSVVATVAGAISYLAHMAQWAAIFGGQGRDRDSRGGGLGLLLMAIVAPLAAGLIRAAISRSREFQADETGARISHKPLALASALRKLHNGNLKKPIPNANPATAHMFIISPLFGGNMLALFSTHPPTEQRIARLEELARKM
jgi:heat shock protein HtpX